MIGDDLVVRVKDKIESFTDVNGKIVPDLTPGDIVTVAKANAVVLSEHGVIEILQEPVKDVPEFTTAAELSKEEMSIQIQKEAEGLLNSDDETQPMAYFIKEFKKLHKGDELVCRTVVYLSCNQQVVHSFGLFPKASGDCGSGKSSSIKSALALIPQNYIYQGSFSAKALHYSTDLRPGMIVFSDDTVPSPDLVEFLKASMSAFHEPQHHKTVVSEGGKKETKTLTIPPETVFIMATVWNTDDDQLTDRHFSLSIEKNKMLDEQYAAFLLERAETADFYTGVTREMNVCREIIRLIKDHKFRVLVPFAKRIVFSDEGIEKRRSQNQFFDFLWASAVLRYKKRNPVEDAGVITITATVQDFTNAIMMFGADPDDWSLKLSKREREILQLIKTQPGINEREISEKTKMNKGNLSRLLHGYPARNIAGLMSRAPVNFEEIMTEDTRRLEKQWRVVGHVLTGEQREVIARLMEEAP
jgi:hypothetical protein